MGTPKSVKFEVKEQPPLTILVTTDNGQQYELNMAIMVLGVIDQGMTNPLDGLPIFQVGSQLVMQVKKHGNG